MMAFVCAINVRLAGQQSCFCFAFVKKNVDCRFATGKEQQSPMLKSDVLLIHSSNPTSSLCGLCCSKVMSSIAPVIITLATRGLCHLNVNI